MPAATRSLLVPLCIVLLAVGSAGCGTVSSMLPTETKEVPKDTLLVMSSDSTELRPEVARLYTLEAELLTTTDSAHTARLLNRAMTDLAALLRDNPQALEDDAVRELYGGLTTEYRRFHGYGADPDSLTMARGRIFSVRARLFDSLDDVEDPFLKAEPPAGPTEVEGMSVPLTSNRLVNESIEYLQKETGRHVDQWLQRAQVYGPMIDHILAEEGVPPELKYLAMVESGLNPQARSWAGAVGIWQFMSATGRRYDLRMNAWVDERRDPEKATRAAARHLKDLHEEFGDWHLAMAAYNCGAGCVRSALRQADADDPTYWDAYDHLPRETQGYVPMFIAATRIMSNPDAYEVGTAPATPAFAYDYVPVHGSMLSLRTVAELAGTERSTIQSLNPELRRGRVPPSKDRYHLRIPLGSYPRFAWNYADLPERQKQPATTYTVRSGDTLSEIAVRFGTSSDVLRRLNSMDDTLLRAGDTLVVPVREYDSALADTDPSAQQPIRVQYGMNAPVQPLDRIEISGRSAPTGTTASDTEAATPSSPSLASTESEDESATVSSTYEVQQDDTLGGIAQRFGVSVQQLRSWNDLNGSRIYPGQRLQISE